MNPQDPLYPTDQTGQSAAQDLPHRIQADGGAVAETAKRDLDDITRQAASDVKALREGAGEQVSAATEKVKSFAGDQKDLLAGQITGLADAVNKVAGELDQSDQATIARYARDLAGGLSNIGNDVQNNDVDQLMSKAQSFGKSQPLAFLGAAALAGFVASRFAVASAHRSQQTASPGQPATGATTYRSPTSTYSEGEN